MKDWIIDICCQWSKRRKKVYHIRVCAKNYSSAVRLACHQVYLFGKIRIKARMVAA